MHTIGQQLTIPQLKAHLSTTRIQIGALGEQLVARALETTGYRVAITHQNGDLTVYDLHGEIFYVEVKTARKSKDAKWRFTLYKLWQGRVCTDHRYTDLVVLVCVLKTGDCVPFVVPTIELIGKTQACITSYPTDYAGWLAQYRQNIRKLTLGRGL